MEISQFNVRQTIIVAILVLYLGKSLTKRIKFFQDFNIPDAVTDGVLVSLIFWLCYAVFKFQVEFDLNIRNALLIIFFTTIGLSSKLKTLLQGGKPLLILLATAVSFLFLQNLTGLAVAALMGYCPDRELTIGIKHGQKNVKIDYNTMLNSFLVIGLAVGLGIELNYLVAASGLRLPDFVT